LGAGEQKAFKPRSLLKWKTGERESGMGQSGCENVVWDNGEFICADTGEVLSQDEIPYAEPWKSSTMSRRADSKWGAIDTYMVPRSPGEENDLFYRLVKAQTRVKYGRIHEQASREFESVVDVLRSHYPSIPQQVLDDARRDFAKVVSNRRMLTRRIIRKHAIAILYYWIKRAGIPMSQYEYLKLFPRDETARFMKTYAEVVRRNGKVQLDYRAFISKALSYLGLERSDEIMKEAVEIAEKIRSVSAVKPNVLAVASVIHACERRGIKVGKMRLANALGVTSYYKALRIARSVFPK
jgi:transcription initiation factor TFIIIB Brf1 subunit/transcription initiation factor TFIIB